MSDDVLHAIECDCAQCKCQWEELEKTLKYRSKSCFETGWTREERYILNKIRSDYLQKLEDKNVR